MKICICEGGNIGHVIAGFFAAQDDLQVSLLTTKPKQWSWYMEVIDVNGKSYKGKLERISSEPKDVIPEVDIVLFCLPSFALHDVLCSIAPYLEHKALVGTVVSSTGFFFEAMNVLPKSQPLFGFQRVPFISRIINYGRVAELKGYKESLSVAVEQSDDKEAIRATLEKLFNTPTKLLDSFYEVSLSNINLLLNTARLYTMWKNWEPGASYDRNPDLYCDWTIEAAELLIAMDDELQTLLKKIGIEDGVIPSVLKCYDCKDAVSLTVKFQTMSAFKGIMSPMKLNKFGKYEPDFDSRYFMEGFSYGLKYIYDLASEKKIDCPNLTMIYKWGVSICKNNICS